MNITRSLGIIPRYENGLRIPCFTLPGGGFKGNTSELDQSVQEAAKLLYKHMGPCVEIRFNADRLSGGAFFKGKETLGITARQNHENAPIAWSVYCDHKYLLSPSMANERGFRPYFWSQFLDMESCLTWIRENTKTGIIDS